MARYNTSFARGSISDSTVISSPYEGAFTELTGNAPYTVTIPNPTLYPGSNQTFYNATLGTVTLSTPSGIFTGTGGNNSNTIPVYSGNVVSVTSDGTDYVVISEDGSALVATSGSFSGAVSITGLTSSISFNPASLSITSSATGTIDNVNIGNTTRGSGKFNTLAADNQVTFTANIPSTTSGTGTVVITGGLGVSGTITAPTVNAALTGNASSAAALQTPRTINETSFDGTANITINQLRTDDNRIISPSEGTAGYARFGFTSWANNNSAPYADYLHLRSYTDSSGGNDNLVLIRKDTIGMRIYQQSYGSASAYSTYKDVAFTDGTGASGSWGISVTGSAGSVAWGNVSSKPSYLMYYQGFTLDANTMDSNATGFSYSVNCPWTGPIAKFSAGGNYDLQLNSGYNVYGISYRARNGDAGSWLNWRQILAEDYWINNKYFGSDGIIYAASSSRSPIFYDNNDTSYYMDAAADRSTNINGFSARTVEFTKGTYKYNTPRPNHTSDTNYWVGVMGWGTTDLNTIFDYGCGFWDSWSNPGNQPSGTSHWTGFNSLHYTNSSGTRYGWQMTMGAGDSNLLYVRGQWGGSPNAWRKVQLYDVNGGLSTYSTIMYDGNDTGYYCDPNSTTRVNLLRTTNWLYLDNNYGHSIVGVYTSTIFQGVFAMGDSYKLTAGGGINNLYGMCWSYPSAGGIAANLDSHGMIVAINGGFGSCMSYSIKASGNVTAYSDERLKKNWKPLPENFVSRLAEVKVGTYDRMDGERLRQVGVSAQSLRPLIPEAVIEANDDIKTLSVSYGNAALASAVELAKEVVQLKEQIKILTERLDKIGS